MITTISKMETDPVAGISEKSSYRLTHAKVLQGSHSPASSQWPNTAFQKHNADAVYQVTITVQQREKYRTQNQTPKLGLTRDFASVNRETSQRSLTKCSCTQKSITFPFLLYDDMQDEIPAMGSTPKPIPNADWSQASLSHYINPLSNLPHCSTVPHLWQTSCWSGFNHHQLCISMACS